MAYISAAVQKLTGVIPDVSVMDAFRYVVGLIVTIAGVVVIVVGAWTGIADIAGLIMVAAGMIILGYQQIGKQIGNLLP